MTLREFIEQERRECHIFDIEEFGENCKALTMKVMKKYPLKNLKSI